VAVALVGSVPARAQLPVAADASAVYLDDSTRATETLAQLDQLIRVGSLPEAARTLQSLLESDGVRLLPTDADGDLFRPVRATVHAAILARPDLLSVYAESQQPAARAALDAGDHAFVARTRFLTPAGFEATLRVAQDRLEAARFHAAHRALAGLERHPGFEQRIAEAAALAAVIARYADTPAAWATASRWGERAGTPVAIEPAETPPGLGARDRAAIPTAPPSGTGPALEGIVPTPLSVATLPIARSWASQPVRGSARPANWAFPAILDEITIINDGDAVTAYDRFTLRPRWQFPPAPVASSDQPGRDADRSRGRTRLIEDPATVTVHGDRVLAPLGNVINGRREGNPFIVCLRRDTGAPLWRVRADTLHPDLADASVRGPVVVHADTALVMLRRNERSRRTISASIAALDLRTGDLRWHRFLGAVGALPYQQQTRSPQSIALVDGVAVVVDEIGIVAAVEAADGTPLWVRRGTALAPDNQTRPWTVHAPVAAGAGRVALVSPDRTEILAIDTATGEIAARRPSPAGNGSVYLLALPGSIAAVDALGVSFFDREDINRRVLPRVDAPPARAPFVGRAVAAPGVVYAPVDSGVLAIDTASGDRTLIPLDHAGNIDIAEGQLLAADDTRLRSYLAWETAAAILARRAEAEPGNPEHPVSFAELAYRAGKPDRIVPAVDDALAAIARAGGADPARGLGTRLFDSILDMVARAHGRPADDAAPPRPLPRAVVAALIDRLDRLADTPGQRVAQLLAKGRDLEQTGEPVLAVETYQSVLADALLASTPWRGRRLNVRAEIEATRRILAVAAANGPSVYERFGAEAAAELERRDAALLAPDELGSIARRYPLAVAAVRARLLESERLAALEPAREAAGRDALIAGNSAVDLVRRQLTASIPVPPELVGEAFGRQIGALADASRIEEAAALLAEFNEHHAGLVLRDGSGPIDADTLFNTITERLAARRTGPRLGPAVLEEDEPQLIQGYALRPLARPEPRGVARARYDGTLIVAKQGDSLAWHAPDESGALAPVWTRQIDRDPVLLRSDEVSAWLFWPDQTGGWLERTDLADGTPLWTSPAWIDLIRGVEHPGTGTTAPTTASPTDPRAGCGATRSSSRPARAPSCFVERAGRAVALDAATGRELWNARPPGLAGPRRDLAAGVLAVGGLGPDAGASSGPPS
jgi:outer membrane protein assembly factor BamB